MVQLESERSKFEALGVNVAAMTYDSLEILKAFKAAEHLGYPLLHDEKAKHVNALGVRNTEYAEGHMAYGIPLPGIVFLRPNGEVVLTFAVPGYRQRPPIEDVLAAVAAGVSE